MTTTKARTICRDHGTTNPCTGCAADHILGAHANGTRRDTCRKCRAPRRPPAERIDAAALAANDTDLIED